MAYVMGNPPTKKALREMVAAHQRGDGPAVRIFSPGPFPCRTEGVEYVEGPHYPQPHRWYASVVVAGGIVTRVR
jgi:hypothetical protein